MSDFHPYANIFEYRQTFTHHTTGVGRVTWQPLDDVTGTHLVTITSTHRHPHIHLLLDGGNTSALQLEFVLKLNEQTILSLSTLNATKRLALSACIEYRGNIETVRHPILPHPGLYWHSVRCRKSLMNRQSVAWVCPEAPRFSQSDLSQYTNNNDVTRTDTTDTAGCWLTIG